MVCLLFYMRYLKTLYNPTPSFFDLCVGIFVFIPWIRGDFERSLFIVFYTAFLFSLTFGMKPKREYKSLSLALLAIWALVGMFVHSFTIYPNSITYSYKIFYLMIEGYLFILFGIIFLLTVIRYSTNIRFVYFMIPIGLIPWYSGWARLGNTTPIVALGISVVIYLLLSKRFKIAGTIMIIGFVGVIAKWSWLCMKFRSRPYAWYQLLVNMLYHPVRADGNFILDPGMSISPGFDKFLTGLFGSSYPDVRPWLSSLFGGGFGEYINNDYTWVGTTAWNAIGKHKSYTFGWVHLQNDYFHIATVLGPITLLFIFLFVKDSLKIIGIRPILILFLTVLLTSFSDLTMFSPGTAGVTLMIVALTLTDSLTRRMA